MSFNIPNTFVAGTKARADEVNENFASLQDEINKNNRTLVSLSNDIDYIKNEMLEDFVSEAGMMVRSQKSKFCANYGNLSENGVTPDILSANEGTLDFKVGGAYPVLIITNAYGESETFEYVESVNISGYTDGTYNVFLSLEGVVELFNSALYRTPKQPSNVVVNDVWLKTLEPWSCYKFSGVSWIDYDSVPLGTVTIESGAAAKVSNYGFNTQYLDSDCLFLTSTGRANISKRYETDWFNVVPLGTYEINHNLDIDPAHYRARIIARVKEDYNGYHAGDVVETLYSNYSGNEANQEIGCIIVYGRNTVKIGLGNSQYHCCNIFDSIDYSYLLKSNLEYKVIITQDVN